VYASRCPVSIDRVLQVIDGKDPSEISDREEVIERGKKQWGLSSKL
jgi:hypothetical protein